MPNSGRCGLSRYARIRIFRQPEMTSGSASIRSLGTPEGRIGRALAMSPRLTARPNCRCYLRGSEAGSRSLKSEDKDTTMPELLIDFITSLDGYAAADGWPGWWGLEGPEYLTWLGEQPETDYTVLMGATTYRVMSGYAAEGEPGTGALAGMSKIVFSTTLSEPLSWANTQLVAQAPVEAVREMKDKDARSMRTIGSLTLCRSLLKAGLVDRFRVVVFPVITGSSGRERIYDNYPDVALDMISSRTFDGRIQLLEYVPAILAGPPGTNTVNP
jgi:dihydrofolate reductase